MKTTLIRFALALAVVLTGCALFTHTGSGVIVLDAQTLPYTAHAQWDPPPAADNVTNYQVTLDGGAPMNVAPIVNTTCACIQTPITLATAGTHTVSVVAQNQALSTDPATIQSSAPTSVTFQLNLAAGKPVNVKPTK